MNIDEAVLINTVPPGKKSCSRAREIARCHASRSIILRRYVGILARGMEKGQRMASATFLRDRANVKAGKQFHLYQSPQARSGGKAQMANCFVVFN